MSLAPIIGDTGGSWKNKTLVRKKSYWASTSMQKPGVTGKNLSWVMTCTTYTLVCNIYEHKCLWRGRLMSDTLFLWPVLMCVVYLISLVIMMTYISMKPWVSNRIYVVIVQVSRSYRLLVCGIIPISIITVLAPIIDHNSVRGYVEVSFGVALLAPIVLHVCKRKNAEHQVPLCYGITTLGRCTA